jgi:hypothetical protein
VDDVVVDELAERRPIPSIQAIQVVPVEGTQVWLIHSDLLVG